MRAYRATSPDCMYAVAGSVVMHISFAAEGCVYMQNLMVIHPRFLVKAVCVHAVFDIDTPTVLLVRTL